MSVPCLYWCLIVVPASRRVVCLPELSNVVRRLARASSVIFSTSRFSTLLAAPLSRTLFFALRRNPTGWLIDGAFRYTLQFAEQRLDEDSGMAGLPSVSERNLYRRVRNW